MVSNVEIQQQQPPVSLPPSPPAPPTPQAPEYVQNYPYPSYPEYGHHGWHRSHRKSYSEKRLFDLIGHQFTNEERGVWLLLHVPSVALYLIRAHIVALSAAREEYKRHFIPAVIGGVVGGFLLARRGFFGRLVMFGGSVFGGIWVGRRMGQLAGSNVVSIVCAAATLV
ncbi:hypothetical protein M427DRAFT_454282 [Gonapodya prolifera JEL478]|uniref:Uncharacterized protein n=1 Tax=Gonapodya prolifera (strain JEL478) TaxID=1344416 RepID=A0A139AS78_GONPJ|nr:hypothetical protein M427DRAFT_454282 [Gonapodya prolifera JEL478]|eukprot:KXS19611.1 hypothetical protein M427DRAFT_454282 [Gonapodya prolifera JEL478]